MTAAILRAAATAGATAGTVTDGLQSKDVQLAAPMDVGSVLRVIIILVLIIAGAYMLTKYIAQRSLRKGMKQQPRTSKGSASSQYPEFGHLVSVADRIAVDRDKTLMVIEFEGRYYLVGTTADGFQRLAEAEIPETEPEAEDTENVSAADQPADEGTFGQRFRKAFGIVLRSYLPAGMRREGGATSSFDSQLQAKIRADSKKAADRNGRTEAGDVTSVKETPGGTAGAEDKDADTVSFPDAEAAESANGDGPEQGAASSQNTGASGALHRPGA